MKITKIVNVNVILILLVASLVAGCNKEKAPPPSNDGRLVKTLIVGEAEQGFTRVYPGKTSADRKAELSFEVSGRLIEIAVREGERVNKQQLLARLDPRDYQNKVDEENAKFIHSGRMLARFRELLSSGTVSQAEHDEKEAEYRIAKANLATARKALEDTSLYAPFHGIISRRFVENHEQVKPKQPIMNLKDLDELEIIINIPEQDIPQERRLHGINTPGYVKPSAEVTFITLPHVSFPVTVKEFSAEADSKTQTYRLTLSMPAPKKYNVLPGMTADVAIHFASPNPNEFAIPIDAISTEANGDRFVWLVNTKTSTVSKQIVTLGEPTKKRVLVLSGLKPGDEIVTAGVAYLFDNMKVKIIKGKIGKQ